MASFCAFALPAAPAFGEGSGDLNTGPGGAARQALTMADNSNYTVLYVYAQAGETIQLGNSAMGIPGAGNVLVYAPGADVDNKGTGFPEDPVFATDIFDCDTDDPGTGVIATRSEELAGPLPNAGGYDPCEFVAPAAGIYPVIMMSQNPAGVNNLSGFVDAPVQNVGFNIAMWDATVRDAGGAVQPGRTYSFAYRLRAAPTGSGGAQVFPYTKSGYQYQVNFTAQSGVNWVLTADDQGVIDAQTGERTFASFACGDDNNPDVNRPCLDFTATTAPAERRYPLFLNQVDPLVISGPGGLGQTLGYSSAPISPASNPLSTTFTGSAGQAGATAQGSGGTINIGSPAAMGGLDYTLTIDTNHDGVFGNANDVVHNTDSLAASGSTTYAWNGKDAAGNVPACGDYPYQIRSTLSEVHFTMNDVENSGGTRIERLSLPNDPALGNPLAASYNNHDPYKNGYVVTNGTPAQVTDGISGPGFNAWSSTAAEPGGTGNTDLIDTWTRLPEVAATGTLHVACQPPPPPPPSGCEPNCPPQPSADVTIRKSVSAPRVLVGETVTYRAVAQNNGPGTATNVKVDDKVPSRLDARSASSEQGDCSVRRNRVHCELGTMTVGQEVTIEVRARAIRSGRATNSASVDSPQCTTHPCDDDPARVVIVKPKLKLTKKVGKRVLRAGETTNYTIRVSNPSDVRLRNVRTCDRLPAGLVYVSSKPKAKLSKGQHCWTVKRLAAGKSKTYRVTVRALRGTSGRLVNTATATSPDAKRDRARRTVRVIAGAVAPTAVTG